MRARISAYPTVLLLCGALGACSGDDSPGAGGATGGGGGAGGTGGAGPNGCYAQPNPSPAFPASRDPDLLARAGTVVGSCMEDDGIVRNLGYMWNADVNPSWFYGRFVLQAECLANARCGCKAVEACLGFTLKRSDAGSCEPCSGSVFNECGPGYQATIDCGRVGFVCDPLAYCVEAPAVACDRASFVPACDATGRPEVCSPRGRAGNVAHLTQCSKLGLQCEAGDCKGKGNACTGSNSGNGDILFAGLGCSGSNLEACVGGKQTTLNCAERGPGFSCQNVGTHYFCGLASECGPAQQGPTLTSMSEDVTCEGANVVICNAGRVDRIDCTALGFTGCEVNKANNMYGCVPGPML